MEKIIVMSEYGFKLSSNPEKWISCDKKFLSSIKFKKLKIGDTILGLYYNEKNFVKDVTLTIGLNQECEGEPLISPLLNVNHIQKSSLGSPSPDIKATDEERNNLKTTCLMIAFKDVDVTDSNGRSSGIRHTQKLFVELEEANFYRW